MKLKDGKSRLLGWRLISNFPPNGFLHPASSIHLLEQGTTAGLRVRQLCTIDNLEMLKMAISRGLVRLPKRMNFRKNSKRPLTPPHF